jgi:hypothetical protein
MTSNYLVVLVGVLACRSASHAPVTQRLAITDTISQPSDGRLGSISGLAVDASGRVVVVDAENAQVAFLDSTGHVLHAVGRRGQGPGELVRPRSISLSADSVWIADGGSSQVLVYTVDGTYVRTIPALPWLSVAEITFNAHGQGLLAQHGRDTALARRVSGLGHLGTKLGRPHALPEVAVDFQRAKTALAGGTIPEAFLSYSAPALAEDGSAWVLRIVSGSIERYSPTDSLLWTATLPDTLLARVRSDLAARTQADTSVGFPFPNVLVAGTPVGDTLWILLQGVRGETTIGRLSPDGTWLPWLQAVGTGRITAFAVAHDASAVYLLDQSEGTLVRIHLPREAVGG